MVPFDDMEEYSLEALRDQIEENVSKIFYCSAMDIKEVKKEIEAAGIDI